MRWRLALVVVASALALLAPLVLSLPFDAMAPPRESVSVDLAQPGDKVVATVQAFDVANGTLVYASAKPETFTVGVPGDTLPGLASALANASAGETVNATLGPADAFGSWSWANLVNLSRVQTAPRVTQVSRDQLSSYLGHDVQVGDVVDLPSWPATVIALTSTRAQIRADPALGASVHRYPYWPSVVTNLTNDTVTFRNDPTVGTPVHIEDDGQTADGRVTLVNDTRVAVDFNAPLAGETVRVVARVEKVEAGSSTLGLVGKAEAADCQSHHAGFVSFQATTDVAPNPNGTAWVNVTVADPWHHQVTGATVSVGDQSQPVPTLRPGEAASVGFLVPSGGNLPVAIEATAHFNHGGGAPDDLNYHSSGVVNTSARHAAPALNLAGARVNALGTLWGRVLGWVAIPLLLLPAYLGHQARRRRLRGVTPRMRWPAWLDLHALPAIAATLLAFAHGATLMAGAYAGNSSVGVWTGYLALAVLGILGVSGLVMAKWAPLRWKEARGFHAWLTIAALALGALHALLIGTMFKSLR